MRLDFASARPTDPSDSVVSSGLLLPVTCDDGIEGEGEGLRGARNGIDETRHCSVSMSDSVPDAAADLGAWRFLSLAAVEVSELVRTELTTACAVLRSHGVPESIGTIVRALGGGAGTFEHAVEPAGATAGADGLLAATIGSETGTVGALVGELSVFAGSAGAEVRLGGELSVLVLCKADEYDIRSLTLAFCATSFLLWVQVMPW